MWILSWYKQTELLTQTKNNRFGGEWSGIFAIEKIIGCYELVISIEMWLGPMAERYDREDESGAYVDKE